MGAPLALAYSETARQLKLSDVIGALSYALDITEGQPEGHAARSCMIGMRISRELRLPTEQASALFYGLLLKDLGCSSNAAKMCYLFGSDDRAAKRDVKTVDFTSVAKSVGYLATHVATNGSILEKATKFVQMAVTGPAKAKELIAIRCDRGATIAAELQFPPETSDAIRALDEHWDGLGHPAGLKGEEIPLLARILGLAQTAEVFIREKGLDAAIDVCRNRSGTWFDPDLVEIFAGMRGDSEFWRTFHGSDTTEGITEFEPGEYLLTADEDSLDRIAHGFSQVIDAKSPWTFLHSEGVAEISSGVAAVLGFSPIQCRYIRRAALLHDVGKLGISNLILDKPGKLDAAELAEMRKHPQYTFEIMSRVAGFRELADLAASHHERLDGKGYHRGKSAKDLTLADRVIGVADMYEALAAKRPYRQDLAPEEVMNILHKHASGGGICPEVLDALVTWLNRSAYEPIRLAA